MQPNISAIVLLWKYLIISLRSWEVRWKSTVSNAKVVFTVRCVERWLNFLLTSLETDILLPFRHFPPPNYILYPWFRVIYTEASALNWLKNDLGGNEQGLETSASVAFKRSKANFILELHAELGQRFETAQIAPSKFYQVEMTAMFQNPTGW